LKLPEIPRDVADFGLDALRRFIRIEGAQQATVLAAQAFTSLIPFLVVAAAVGPGGDLGDRIVDRFGLSGSSARSVQELFNSAGETESAVTWVSVIILVLSALSFTRALQRTFQRTYDVPAGDWRQLWRGLAWLLGAAVWLVVSSPLRGTLSDVGHGIVLPLAASMIAGFALWLWTPSILLGAIDWRRLAPGAAVSGLLGVLLSVASGIYVPILMTWSADRYGLIGIAFSLQSWLLVGGFVVVIGAVVGAVTNERYGERLDRLARRGSREPVG
jgi:membrane protein